METEIGRLFRSNAFNHLARKKPLERPSYLQVPRIQLSKAEKESISETCHKKGIPTDKMEKKIDDFGAKLDDFAIKSYLPK